MKRQSTLAFELFSHILAHSDLKEPGMSSLALNLWTLAQSHALEGDLDLATDVGEEAIEVCSNERPYCPYTLVYQRAVDGWKNRPPPFLPRDDQHGR